MTHVQQHQPSRTNARNAGERELIARFMAQRSACVQCREQAHGRELCLACEEEDRFASRAIRALVDTGRGVSRGGVEGL